jgi:hypothetical protein
LEADLPDYGLLRSRERSLDTLKCRQFHIVESDKQKLKVDGMHCRGSSPCSVKRY